MILRRFIDHGLDSIVAQFTTKLIAEENMNWAVFVSNSKLLVPLINSIDTL